MIEHFVERRFPQKITSILFVGLTIWWLYIYFYLGNTDIHRNLVWAASYQAVAICGAIWGLVIAKSWGGLRSVMGRAIIFFALGLLLQAFGQSVFSWYNLFLGVEVPYPSIADIGFFGSIPCYAYAIYQLGKASGITVSMRSFFSKIQALLIPLIMLGVSYYFFLRGYVTEGTSALQVFLDFGYPIGQAIYVSIAIITYLLSKRVLGGVMRNKVLFILFALAVQYAADNNFLYQAIEGGWVNGGYGDYIYLVAYFLMAYGLAELDTVFKKKSE